MEGASGGLHEPSDAGKAREANPFFCKSCPPQPDPWRQPNASDDLIELHPERVAFVKQQKLHFLSRVRLASLRPRAIYGPGLLSNTLSHQSEFFCLHQPLPPLPIPEAHRYHRFTLVDLLEHDATDRGDKINNSAGFFLSLASAGPATAGSGRSNSSAVSPEKSAKTAASTIASFLLSAAPAAALGPHAFRKVPMQQPLRPEQPAAGGTGLLRSFSFQSVRQQQHQQQQGAWGAVASDTRQEKRKKAKRRKVER